MARAIARLAVPALLLPAMAAYMGGWAVITVDDLPDHVVTGQSVELAFTVRQHGRTPLTGLQPTVEAKAGRLAARASTRPGPAAGRYAATLTLPESGEWTITIHSGFHGSKITLLPLRAIAAGAPTPRSPAAAERGRQLFVAKGCVTCHVHGDVDEPTTVRFGPELTGRRYPADYLARFLADPTRAASSGSRAREMPNLDLKEREIGALVAFLNGERQALR